MCNSHPLRPSRRYTVGNLRGPDLPYMSPPANEETRRAILERLVPRPCTHRCELKWGRCDFITAWSGGTSLFFLSAIAAS